ncbi:MAG: antitoxin [Deltaproteobacteria bacterium]|nr:antitoxin [Deltaproteobacteria bacterium]
MNTKLTLRLDEDIIRRAKEYSKEVGKPVSRLVEDYFRVVTSPNLPQEDLPPLVKSLRGCIEGSGVDEEDYRRHLEEKYL